MQTDREEGACSSLQSSLRLALWQAPKPLKALHPGTESWLLLGCLYLSITCGQHTLLAHPQALLQSPLPHSCETPKINHTRLQGLGSDPFLVYQSSLLKGDVLQSSPVNSTQWNRSISGHREKSQAQLGLISNFQIQLMLCYPSVTCVWRAEESSDCSLV